MKGKILTVLIIAVLFSCNRKEFYELNFSTKKSQYLIEEEVAVKNHSLIDDVELFFGEDIEQKRGVFSHKYQTNGNYTITMYSNENDDATSKDIEVCKVELDSIALKIPLNATKVKALLILDEVLILNNINIKNNTHIFKTENVVIFENSDFKIKVSYLDSELINKCYYYSLHPYKNIDFDSKIISGFKDKIKLYTKVLEN